MTLYLKYRPRNLDELGLTDVAEALRKIVKSRNIPHAFLFAGPKGTGKTSAARILAKIINCEKLGKGNTPCDRCKQCVSITRGNNLDVIEMDAASHRGIDDARVLRDAVKLAPTAAKKKVYIIDEVHMLTTEASNALLKTLEEPPEHVVFILATTNPEKLIDTIRSRTTFIPFNKASMEEIVKTLQRVAKGERVKIDKDALEIIAQSAGGAFRDAIKILEQLIVEERELTKEFLEEHLLRKKAFDLDKFISLLVERDTKELLREVGTLGARGASVEGFLQALLGGLRAGLLAKVGVTLGPEELSELPKDDLIYLIELFSEASKDISDSPIEELPLELAVIKWCHTEPDPALRNDDSPSINKDPVLPKEVAVKGSVDDDVWKHILSLVKPINASIEALLRAARPIGYDGKTLTLGVYYRFHKERLEDVQHRRVLEDVVGKVLKSATRVVCTLVAPPPKKIIEEAKAETVLTEGKDRDIIKVAEEIFGN